MMNKNGKYVDEYNIIRYYKNGQIHRIDGPACIYPNGTKFWQLNGRFHRVGGPAYISSDGVELWYFNGQRHRVDGPAVIYPNGDKEYWMNGEKLTKDEWFQQLSKKQRIKMAFKLDQL